MPRYCVKDGCEIRASFNLEGETKALYCSKHKLDKMINVISKTCLDCLKQPTCNYENETKALYCSTHKLDKMIDIKNKRCLLCNPIAIYNVEGETKALYCSTHKKEGMVNVKDKKCLDCKKIPSCNYENETKPIYCSTHKKEGMVNVKDKKCLDCKKIPSYNYENETKPIYCSTHKKDGMVNVQNKTCLDCLKQPTYNYENETKPIYCNDHKKDGMVNVRDKICLNDWCKTQVTKKYDGYCLHCYMNMFPDKPVARNYKTKEQSVVDYIKDNFPNVDWIADKRVSDGCSKRRPDLLLHLGNQILIIEVDENKHTDYNCSCENKRIMELSLDVGHIPVVFIRFNPDMYLKQKKKITSCWGLNGNGILVIKKKDEWIERLSRLSDVVKYWLENITDKTIETIHLYYDE